MADHIIVGEYADHSGISEMVYGPFDGEQAQQVAVELTEGLWHGMRWSAIPLHRLPGQRPPRPKPEPETPRTPWEPTAEQSRLYQILEQRTDGPTKVEEPGYKSEPTPEEQRDADFED